ncbi:MAG: hypothetical protein ACPGVZ_07555 [Myxococcota bacterium]
MNFELARVERLNLGLSAGAVAASLALVSPHFAGSLAAGAFLEALNLGAIHRGATQLFSGQIAGSRTWIGLFSMRFLTLAAAIYITMQAGANVAGLLIGLSITMPATLIDAWLNRPEVVDPAKLPSFVEGMTFADAEDQSDDEYWENYSVWRPGRLITSERDDLLSEAAAEVAAEERALERAHFQQARAAYENVAPRGSAQDEETR